MANNLNELCAILVEETFGNIAARIWETLAEHGRSTIPRIAQLSAITLEEMTPVFPVLLAHQAVQYAYEREYQETFYSVNLANTYNLIRLSRLNLIVRKSCGRDSAHLITNIAQYGMVSVGEMVEAYELGQTKPNEPSNREKSPTPVQGKPRAEKFVLEKFESPIKNVQQMHTAIWKLLKAGFLMRAYPRLTQTAYDAQRKLEAAVKDEEFPDGKITGPKAAAAFARSVKNQKRRQMDADEKWEDKIQDGSTAKRQKTNGHVLNGVHDADAHFSGTLSDDLMVCVDYRKYVLAARSRSLAGLSARYLGPSTAAIYNALLTTLERDMRDVKETRAENIADDDDDEDWKKRLPTCTSQDIIRFIDPSADLTMSLKISSGDMPKTMPNGVKRAKVVNVDEDFSGIGIKQEPRSDSEDEHDSNDATKSLQERAKTFELVDKHLQSLAESAMNFCERANDRTPVQWLVPYQDLTKKAILEAVDETITARFGKKATRIVRMLRSKGKLEEKQVSSYSMLDLKEVRTLTSELYAAGFLETQELAKDNSRHANKCMYLWYFDIEKVQRLLLNQCYQAMCRLYQRMTEERKKYEDTFSKSDMLNSEGLYGDGFVADWTETKGKKVKKPLEKHHLIMRELKTQTRDFNAQDHKLLKTWKAMEAVMLGQILRLDDMVLLLRDFGGEYIPISA